MGEKKRKTERERKREREKIQIISILDLTYSIRRKIIDLKI